ncbi:MAG: peptidylprolyl isomerase [Elainellaceae cyanobacterium]
MRVYRWLATFLLVSSVALAGCSAGEDASVSSAPEATASDTSVEEAVEEAVEEVGADLPRLDGEAVVEMKVNGETIAITVDGTRAPITAGNFVDLVQKGVYDGVAFHRVVKEPEPFVVQGGDPQSQDQAVPMAQLGTGGYINPETASQRYIPLEIQPAGEDAPIYGQPFSSLSNSPTPELTHTRGAVAMARSQFPDSASSQFYFALADLSFLDGDYAVFGYVDEGDMDVVDGIQQGDRIESAQVISGLENLQTPAE